MQSDTARNEARFEFGKNWADFLRSLTDERILVAENSLREMLGLADLSGKTFLDVGCGSGLFSLSAMKLGADRVHSFDYDPASVGCAEELRRRYFPAARNWTIESGDALSEAYIRSLGVFDVVYSWGVLHHTGAMWKALNHVTIPVRRPGGKLFIAIYNDQGLQSRVWRTLKEIHCRLPPSLRTPYVLLFAPVIELRSIVYNALSGNALWHHRTHYYKESRGMSWWHDMKDWVGGYPFEYAKPEEIFRFFRARGFRLEELTTIGGGAGNNQFVFTSEG